MIIEIWTHDTSEKYLVYLYKTRNPGKALVWLKDQINALQRPVKIRINRTFDEQKETSSYYPNADVDGMITHTDEPKYSG